MKPSRQTRCQENAMQLQCPWHYDVWYARKNTAWTAAEYWYMYHASTFCQYILRNCHSKMSWLTRTRNLHGNLAAVSTHRIQKFGLAVAHLKLKQKIQSESSRCTTLLLSWILALVAFTLKSGHVLWLRWRSHSNRNMRGDCGGVHTQIMHDMHCNGRVHTKSQKKILESTSNLLYCTCILRLL